MAGEVVRKHHLSVATSGAPDQTPRSEPALFEASERFE